ncbi:hypothetical protein L596_020356 [Steinernema carpocapsae]|uniref:Uncharacterized protein n=1 Tax=Steinernema carpocapsae TaxID=34508 RepID=A0A4U5MTY2_STECR|nr:hypothetical protein L596_020356 [Steinernema carpocapsae]
MYYDFREEFRESHIVLFGLCILLGSSRAGVLSSVNWLWSLDLADLHTDYSGVTLASNVKAKGRDTVISSSKHLNMMYLGIKMDTVP